MLLVTLLAFAQCSLPTAVLGLGGKPIFRVRELINTPLHLLINANRLLLLLGMTNIYVSPVLRKLEA